MIRTNNRSHAGMLERFRIALNKAETNPGIARALENYGYGPEVIAEGKLLLESTRLIFDDNLNKKDEQSAVRTEFAQHRKKMEDAFREHRRRALLIFKNNETDADRLAISGKYPTKFYQWLETVRKFYSEILSNPKIQEKCLKMNFKREDAEAGLADIAKLEQLNADRKWVKGVSEDSTEQKDKAFIKLNDWMSDFYTAARLALKKEPELLEVLYKSA